jgi:hypothetical protein
LVSNQITIKLKGHFQFLSKENTIPTNKTACNFAAHEILITKGEQTSLKGWWRAGVECRKHYTKDNGAPNPSAYAKAASKVADDNLEGTIRVYVSAVVKVQEMGYTIDEFKGIEHLRTTIAGMGQRKVETKAEPSSVRFTRERKEQAASALRKAGFTDREVASLLAFGALGNK